MERQRRNNAGDNDVEEVGNFLQTRTGLIVYNVANCKLPQQRKVKKFQELFFVKIFEEKDLKVKVHYVGYIHCFDEWKEWTEIEIIHTEQEPRPVTTWYTPLSSFDELVMPKDKEWLVMQWDGIPKDKNGYAIWFITV